jgi:hypothetical protein
MTAFSSKNLTSACQIESESYISTDGQSARLSWNKEPVWGLPPDFYYYQTVAGLLMWGALSDERTGLSFTVFAGLASAVIFVASYDSQGYGGGIRPHLHTGYFQIALHGRLYSVSVSMENVC